MKSTLPLKVHLPLTLYQIDLQKVNAEMCSQDMKGHIGASPILRQRNKKKAHVSRNACKILESIDDHIFSLLSPYFALHKYYFIILLTKLKSRYLYFILQTRIFEA